MEKWVPRANVRRDLFGIIDIIALDFTRGIVGVQSCGQAYSEHYRKITIVERENALDWLRTPGCGGLELWAWKKDSRGFWKARRHIFIVEDFL